MVPGAVKDWGRFMAVVALGFNYIGFQLDVVTAGSKRMLSGP